MSLLILPSRRIVRPKLIVPAGWSGADPDAPPTFQAGQVMVYQSTFDSYVTPADAFADGWQANGASVQDTSGGATGGANLIIPGNGTGNALRLVYNGTANDGNVPPKQEARSWGRSFVDPLLGKPGKGCYISYDARITATSAPGIIDEGQPTHVHSSHYVQVKWLELWTTALSNRAQFSTSPSFSTNGVPYGGSNDGSGTLWDFYARAEGSSPVTPQAGQVSGPFAYQLQGTWMNVKHKYMTQSAVGARDGLAKMWLNDSLILAVEQAKVGVAPPNRFAGTQNWCEQADVDAFFTNVAVDRMTLGSVSACPTLWAWTIDYDNVKIWRDP